MFEAQRKRKRRRGIMERFWEKVNMKPDGCWEWQASRRGKQGYGGFHCDYKIYCAHRFLYERIFGIIPAGFELDHLCRNPRCVKPSHLQIVTRSQNTSRGIGPSIARAYQLAKTHCPYGHPYNEANTYIRPDNGARECRTCRIEANTKWKENHVITI